MPIYYRHDGCALTKGDPAGYWGVVEFKCDCGTMRKRPYTRLETSTDPNAGPQTSDKPATSAKPTTSTSPAPTKPPPTSQPPITAKPTTSLSPSPSTQTSSTPKPAQPTSKPPSQPTGLKPPVQSASVQSASVQSAPVQSTSPVQTASTKQPATLKPVVPSEKPPTPTTTPSKPPVQPSPQLGTPTQPSRPPIQRTPSPQLGAPPTKFPPLKPVTPIEKPSPVPSTSATKPSVGISSQPSGGKAQPSVQPLVQSTSPPQTVSLKPVLPTAKPPSRPEPSPSTSASLKPTQGPQSGKPVSTTAQTVATMLGATPLAGTGSKTVKDRNESIKATLEGLATLTAQEKQDRSREATARIGQMSADQIKAMSPADSIKALAELTCHKTALGTGTPKIPLTSQTALTKLYGSMKMDTEFLADDRGRREQVLGELTKPNGKFATARKTWGTGNKLATDTTKQQLLSDFHTMQGNKLGVTLDPIAFPALEKGNSGLCSGKLVKVSTNTADNATFDETMDTVDHETTHAYQNDLVEKLDSGALKTDDPRYAQAVLFKLNNQTYMQPPTKLSDRDKADQAKKTKYDSEYAAYKNQPMEAHAWKAGAEASRAFNLDAMKLDMAGVSAAMQKHLPEPARPRAAELTTKFGSAKSLMDGLDLITEIDEIAASAYETLASPVGTAVGGSYIDRNLFAGYLVTFNDINTGSDPAHKKLLRMSTLHAAVIPDAEAYKPFKKLYDETTTLVSPIGKYVTGGYETFSARRTAIVDRGDSFATRLPVMRELHKEMTDITERGKGLVAEFDKLWKTFGGDGKRLPSETEEMNRINGLKICTAEKAVQLKTSEALAAARQRNGIV